MIFCKVSLVMLLAATVLILPTAICQNLISYGDCAPKFSVSSNGGINYSAALESFQHVAPGAQKFGLDLFAALSDSLNAGRVRRDVMISPFAVWSLLLLLLEGSGGQSLEQLKNTLYINYDLQKLRDAYTLVQRYLQITTETVEVGSLQALFTDMNVPPKRAFEDIVKCSYGAQLISVDFHNPNRTWQTINDEVKKATRGLIESAILPQDLLDAKLVLLSSLYFKGQWKYPFNRSLTRLEPFYDDDGNQIGNVEMMMQEADYNYVGIDSLEGHVLELPYGKENRLSMLAILPRKGVALNKVVRNLQSIGTSEIFQRLKAASNGREDNLLKVFIPKFTTHTDMSLIQLLYKLGIEDIFTDKSNLSRIAPDLKVQNILQTTKIIVDEEGTTAAAITEATLVNKIDSREFHLNRSFLYLIIEKTTNSILFIGHLMNPNNYNYSG